MEKTKYRVYKNYKVRYTYITTTRNCEDMIFQIRQMHDCDETSILMFQITRQSHGGKEIVVFTNLKGRLNKWKSDLYN